MKRKISINNYFPISSQTSNKDKEILLAIIKFFNDNKRKYNYLEIGSFLGGSLTPFLMDNYCNLIYSIDKRNQKQDDERNRLWSYESISELDMIERLKKCNLDISKLKTFNGDIKNFKINKKFELAFIDGIHTDTNTFSDFLNTIDKVKKDCIILFHDSSVIFKS